MPEMHLEIINKLGLHARAAAKFVATASAFQADILLCKDDRCANGKSIMGIMMLAAGKGSQISVRAEGDDADAALAALKELINRRFNEDE
ncbi:MAG: HPr family phosphocarrier protein [Gammaproteobacteria bacterium]|nr:HPr family phosphocarrier protein [Gammaproteobacteria bacterium]